MSPASGDCDAQLPFSTELFPVSIQLMSPASGDLKRGGKLSQGSYDGFHSINVPSEWGLGYTVDSWSLGYIGFHSINVPSEWGPKFFK